MIISYLKPPSNTLSIFYDTSIYSSNGSRNVEDIYVEVAQGKLGKTSVHKVLGNYVNDKGNMEDQLKFMEEKAGAVISETNKICSQDKLGKLEWEGKKTVYEEQIIHAVFHNTEAWTNLRKSDWEKLESIAYGALGW